MASFPRNVTLNLTVNAKTLRDTFKGLTTDAQSIVGSINRWKAAFHSVNSELQGIGKQIAVLHAKMTPEAVTKRVRLQLAQEQAQAELKRREESERKRQYKPTTFAGHIGKALGFDVSPGNAGSQSLLGGLGKKLGLGEEATGLLGGIGKALGPATAALGTALAISKTIQGIFNEMVGFVSKANPLAVKRLTLVFDDMAAVIGHTLEPVIDLATHEFRAFADFLASILPSGNELRKALQPIKEGFNNLREVLADVAPYIKDALVTGIRLYGEFLKVFWGGIKKLLDLAKQFGLIKGGGRLTSSVGASAQGVGFKSPEEYAKSIYQAAFSTGKEPQKETAENTRGIWDTLKALPGELATRLEELGAKIGDKLFQGWTFIRDNWRDILQGALAGAFAGLGTSLAGITDLPAKLGTELSKIPDALTSAVSGLPDAIKNALASLPRDIAAAIRGSLPGGGQIPPVPGTEALRRGWDFLRGGA